MGSFHPNGSAGTTATTDDLKQQQRRLSLGDNDELDDLDHDLDDDDHDHDLDDLDNNDVEAQLNRASISANTSTDNVKTESNCYEQHNQQATVASHNVPPAPASNIFVKPNGEIIRRRNVGVPKFLRFLYQMLESEDRDVISWSHKGTAFQIRQPDELALTILPKYFKHNKVSSFQRQLNYFGFKKWTKTQTTICTFSHPCFLRAEKDKMKLIKRKERSGPISGSPSVVLTQTAPALDSNAPLQPLALPSAGPAAPKPSVSVSAKQPRASAAPKSKAIGARELAMRRHSTGALALAAAFMQPTGPVLTNRKRAGTIDLEFETQSQKGSGTSLDVIKEVGLRLPSRAKRKSLPHVMLPPSLKDCRGNQLFTADASAFDIRQSLFVGASPAPMHHAAAVFGGGYFGHQQPQQLDVNGSLKQNALSSAVVPVSATEMLLMQQHLYQRQHSHPGTMSVSGHFQVKSSGSGSNAATLDMSDLSAPLPQTQSAVATSWSVPPGSGYATTHSMIAPTAHHMQPFKFGDSSGQQQQHQQQTHDAFESLPIMDYATNSAQLSSHHAVKLHSQQQSQQQQPQIASSYLAQQQQLQQQHQQQQQQQQQQKDYIDVLLESAALDDQLASQPTESHGAGMPVSWDQPFQHQSSHLHLQQQQQQHVGMPFAFLSQQQQQLSQQQHLQQLAAMGGNSAMGSNNNNQSAPHHRY